MAEAELGRIIDLIMKNPDLIAQIKELGAKNTTEEETESTTEDVSATEKSENDDEVIKSQPEEGAAITAPSVKQTEIPQSKARRNELLRALKPYVSGERGKAIESMMTIADILDMMRTK